MRIVFFSFLIISTLISCKRKGCTNPNAKNYDEKANVDFGCKYLAKAIFWYDEVTSNSLQNDGITSLTYYVSGVEIGGKPSSDYWTGGPNCSEYSPIFYAKDLNTESAESFSYQVRDEYNTVIWSGSIVLKGGTCTAKELVY